MNGNDVEQLIRIIQRLWPSVPNQAPADATTVAVWQVVLCDVPMVGAEAVVVNRARSRDRFPPSPGEIAGHYHDTVDRLAGVAIPDADQAWLEVHTAVQRLGWYSGPPKAWSHPAVAAAADSMTWRELCHGDVMIVRAHFLKSYPAIAARSATARTETRTFAALAEVAELRMGELM